MLSLLILRKNKVNNFMDKFWTEVNHNFKVGAF